MKQSPFVLANKSKINQNSNTDLKLHEPDSLPMFDNTFLNQYKISKLFKVFNYGVRPTKLKKEVLYDQMEYLYDERFNDEKEYVRKSMNKFSENESKTAPGLFYKWIFDFYMKKMNGKIQLVEIKLVNLLFSLHSYASCWEQFHMFALFINENYNQADLNCFLLLRSIIKKEISDANKKLKPKKHLQLYSFGLSIQKCDQFLSQFFPDKTIINAELIMDNLKEELKKMNMLNKISSYDFLSFVIREYKTMKEGKKSNNVLTNEMSESAQTMKVDGQEIDPEVNSKMINPLIKEEMRRVIQEFFEKILKDETIKETQWEALNSAKMTIFRKLEILLTAFFEGNKMLWFNELFIDQPTEENLLYIEDLFKKYRCFIRSEVLSNKEYKEFCKQIIKTPELADKISTLMTEILGEGDDESQESNYKENEQNSADLNGIDEENEFGEFSDPSNENSQNLRESNVFKNSSSEHFFK